MLSHPFLRDLNIRCPVRVQVVVSIAAPRATWRSRRRRRWEILFRRGANLMYPIDTLGARSNRPLAFHPVAIFISRQRTIINASTLMVWKHTGTFHGGPKLSGLIILWVKDTPGTNIFSVYSCRSNQGKLQRFPSCSQDLIINLMANPIDPKILIKKTFSFFTGISKFFFFSLSLFPFLLITSRRDYERKYSFTFRAKWRGYSRPSVFDRRNQRCKYRHSTKRPMVRHITRDHSRLRDM